MDIKTTDFDFLSRCADFCNKIDRYSNLLNLNPEEVETFKNDNRMLEYTFANEEQFKSFVDSFTQCQISNMRVNYSHLIQACKNSNNYTIQIGDDLGIEVPVYAFLKN